MGRGRARRVVARHADRARGARAGRSPPRRAGGRSVRTAPMSSRCSGRWTCARRSVGSRPRRPRRVAILGLLRNADRRGPVTPAALADVRPGGDRRRRHLPAMPLEVRPMVRKLSLHRTTIGGAPAYSGLLGDRSIVAVVTGMGTQLARGGTERLLDHVSVKRVVVVGITGAAKTTPRPSGPSSGPSSSSTGQPGAEYPAVTRWGQQPRPARCGRASGLITTIRTSSAPSPGQGRGLARHGDRVGARPSVTSEGSHGQCSG